MPYNDMIGWALENVDISTKSINNSQKVDVRAFQLEHIQVMYKLSSAFKYSYNATFLTQIDEEECTQGGNNYPNLIKN